MNSHNTRSLKIEATGDFAANQIKPKIRLLGKWLERAGFIPGNRVQILCVAPGVMEIRSTSQAYLAGVSQSSGAQLSHVSALRGSSEIEIL
jgi:hypothetical protein